MDEIGVGIVGCGNISAIYLTNLPSVPNVKVRACADMKQEVAVAQGKEVRHRGDAGRRAACAG